eukprot:915899-Rhodomonas_salina.1
MPAATPAEMNMKRGASEMKISFFLLSLERSPPMRVSFVHNAASMSAMTRIASSNAGRGDGIASLWDDAARSAYNAFQRASQQHQRRTFHSETSEHHLGTGRLRA